MTWRDHALCAAEKIPTEWFFPAHGKRNKEQLKAALDCCNRCPVRRACHAHAKASQNDPEMHRQESGMWGGEIFGREYIRRRQDNIRLRARIDEARRIKESAGV